jgi:MFS family permease
VSAGIGVLGMASPMLQEVFGGRLIGLDIGFGQLDTDQKKQIAAIAAAFTGLLSLCNIGGRIGWASASDKFGRKLTYAIFFIAGLALYSAIPFAAKGGMVGVFVLLFAVIITMYGGGFSTIPAYLADIFGTHHVGAIHGRLLTAWSTAGVLGPVLVNYIREYQLSVGVPREAAYNQTMYVLAGLLLCGFVCNLLVRPCAEKYYMSDEEVAAQKHITVAEVIKEDDDVHADFEDFVEEAREPSGTDADPPVVARALPSKGGSLLLVLAWTAVGAPLALGIWMTLLKTAALFH